MGIEAIGTGIKTRLQTISKLRVFAPNEIPDSISDFPAAVILPSSTTYNMDFDASPDYTFRIIVFLTIQDKPSALNKLMDYIEPTGTYSVIAAIEGDRTLDSTADDCQVKSNSGFGAIPWGGHIYLGTEFELQVYG